MRTNPFEITRNIYTNQATVGSAFRNEDGAIDLASIMVGIIVIGLIGAVIAATVFAVIPWAQDAAAKQQLDSVHQAENTYLGLSSSDLSKLPSGAVANSYSNSPMLAQANLLSMGGSYCVVANASGTGYTAYSASSTGTVWMNTDQNTTASKYNGSLTNACPAGYTTSGGTVSVSTPTPTPTYSFTSLALTAQAGSPTTNNGNGNYYGMASSGDGSILVAGANSSDNNNSTTPGYLQRSTDGGKTWAPLTAAGLHNWYGVASSADGQTILAVDHNVLVNGGGYVYLSKDGGQTWTSNPGTSSSGDAINGKLGQHNWTGAAMSRNGQYMMTASDNSGHIWYSADAGATWRDFTNKTNEWKSVSISDDGQTMAAAASSDQVIYMSIDGGNSWQTQGKAVSANWEGVAVSGDGKTVVAGMQASGGCMEVGTRSTANGSTGFTFTMLGMGGNNPGVPSDANYHVYINQDGSKALALATGGHVLVSVNANSHPATTDPVWPNNPTVTDGGFSTAKFQSVAPANQQWWAGGMSSDGSHLAFASISGSPIYTGVWN